VHKIAHLPEAVDDMLRIETYLHEHSPTAADRFAEEIEKRKGSLTEHPFM
jgi:plasmid stabilization system protein ParE